MLQSQRVLCLPVSPLTTDQVFPHILSSSINVPPATAQPRDTNRANNARLTAPAPALLSTGQQYLCPCTLPPPPSYSLWQGRHFPGSLRPHGTAQPFTRACLYLQLSYLIQVLKTMSLPFAPEKKAPMLSSSSSQLPWPSYICSTGAMVSLGCCPAPCPL